MTSARLLLAVAAVPSCLWPDGPRGIGAPSYSTDSIVNAADNRTGYLAPNTIGTIYGVDLSYSTYAIGPADLKARTLPTSLEGVRIGLAGIYAHLLYVSPRQINFIVPANLVEGETDLYVERDNLRGPKLRVRLNDAAPAPFLLDAERVIATHADGSLVDDRAPARAGEVVVIYLTGLGRTSPEQLGGTLAGEAAAIRRLADLSVTLDGDKVPAGRIWYAGITPGYSGLYQINLHLPDNVRRNPEVRVALGEQSSAPGQKLRLE